MDTLLSQLAAVIGPRNVLRDDLEAYAVDWRGKFKGRPMAVLRPADTGQVAECVKICRRFEVPIVPQGGNTGLAAGATPDPGGGQIILSLSRMSQIRSIDKIGMTIELDAGCTLRAAQDAALEVGRIVPLRLASEGSAQIGGLISTNAGGVNVLRYGSTRQFVLGAEVVRADGSIVSGLRHLRKDNAGYDWKQLFIGSEGTLGIVTAAVLRLMPAPRFSVTALLTVADAEAALGILELLQSRLGEAISAFEFMSRSSIDLVRKHLKLEPPIGSGEWYLLVDLTASVSGLEADTEAALSDILEAGQAVDCVLAQSRQQAAALWRIRESITECEQLEGGSVKHDVSVPLGAMPSFLAEASGVVADRFPEAICSMFGHLGDGNIHFNVVNCHAPDAVNRAIHDLIHRYGGSISAEHGIGAYRVDDLARYKPAAEVGLMRDIKNCLDPSGLLNPGKVLLP